MSDQEAGELSDHELFSQLAEDVGDDPLGDVFARLAELYHPDEGSPQEV